MAFTHTVPEGAIANVLSIAGTDPTGGAGIQADLKSFSALGSYGMSVVTAVVAQNTRGVKSYQALDPSLVGDQIDAVFEDVRVDAVKIGMVATAEIAMVIASRLKRYKATNIVLDPVMVAKSGDPLLSADAVDAVRSVLLPMATLITPNLPEAGVLLRTDPPASLDAMKISAMDLLALGSQWVLLKGGHLNEGDEAIDLLAGPEDLMGFAAPRVDTRNTHGTGCTLSSAIAALLPHYEVPEAIGLAKAYLYGALEASDQLSVGDGTGHGPVHHFHALWSQGDGGCGCGHGHDGDEEGGCCGGHGHGHDHDHDHQHDHDHGCGCGGHGHDHDHGHDHGHGHKHDHKHGEGHKKKDGKCCGGKHGH